MLFEKTDTTDVTIAAGAKSTVADLTGSGAITALKVKFPLPSDPAGQKNLLRQLAIRITWDGDKEASVWSPLGPVVPLANVIKSVADTGAPEKGTGIIEGESLKSTIGDAQLQGMSGFHGQWSGGSQLWWRPQREDAHAEEELPPQKAGTYHLIVRLTQAPDYGIIQFSVNGTQVGSPIDLYGDTVSPTQPIDLGTVQLKDGTNTLGMDAVGTDKGGYCAGIDYLKLTP